MVATLLSGVLVFSVASDCRCQKPPEGTARTVEEGRPKPPSAAPAETQKGARAVSAPALRGYALTNPKQVLRLPERLREISGLTDVSDHGLGCLQDEEGIIFVYDLRQQTITREIPFGDPGDFEGLSRVDDRYYALRSDGVLFEIIAGVAKSAAQAHALSLSTKNNEGLGFDQAQGHLLVAPKSRLGKGREFKNARAIFAFNLKSKAMLEEPVLEFDVRAVREFAETHRQPLPTKKKKKGKGEVRVALRLMPSSVAVHPTTQEFFVLSAIDRVLVTFDRHGGVTGYALLDEGLFRQPEGITFLPAGDMVISNEGADAEATLLVFEWSP